MNINKDNSLNSKIKISCERQGDKTLLVDSYFDIPYKLTHYGSIQATDHLEMIMMCSSPGIMDGDILTLDIDCKEGSELKFHTQSYNKIHPMPKQKGAKQYCNFNIEKGASFLYIPHPTIPYKDSIFDAINTINIAKDAHLVWGDIISGGRIHSGEKFEFEKYHTKTKIYQDKKLVMFDNQMIAPKSQPVEDILFFEGFTHQGTLVIATKYASEFKKELDEILLAQFTDSSYGFTMAAKDILMLRIMGTSGDALHDWLINIGNMAWSFIKFKEKEEKENTPQEISAETNTIEDKTPAKALEEKPQKNNTKAEKKPAKKATKTSTKKKNKE